MSGCQVCGTQSTFLYACSGCGERFCESHHPPEQHTCQASAPAAGEYSTRQVLVSASFFLAIVVGLAAFLFVLGPGGPFGSPGSTADAATTTTEHMDGRAVLEAVNEYRIERNRTPIGYHRDLVDLAENRNWSVSSLEGPAPYQVGDGVTCREIEVLTYSGSAEGGSDEAGQAVVDSWVGDAQTRSVLSDSRWDLGAAAVDGITAEGVQVRLVVCHSAE